MNRFEPKISILPDAQKDLWPYLEPAAKSGWVLYGGTAIALRLGHRASVDFDFFTEHELNKDVLRASLSFLERLTVLQDTPDTWTVLAFQKSQGLPVKMSFFGSIDFGRVGEPELTEDGVALVASLKDLLATKLKVILQRAEARDYRDITAILKTGASLAEGVSGAQTLYGSNFQPTECLKAYLLQ